MGSSLALFIMCHSKPEQLQLLLEATRVNKGPRIIHVDAKTALGLRPSGRGVVAIVAHEKARYGAEVMRSRFTNWGGWSLCSTLLSAIRRALVLDPEWRYFVNLSGQCFPLKPLPQIAEQLADGKFEYVESKLIADLPADDWHHRWSPMVETPLKTIVLRGKRLPPPGLKMLHKGSQWIMLSREFCTWLVDADRTRQVSRFLKHAFLSDELFIQNIFSESPFADRMAPHYGRFLEFPGPRVLTATDYPQIKASGALFGRKFDGNQDAAILDLLAAGRP
jgi:hypothetical protein